MAGPSAPRCTGRFSFFCRFIDVRRYTKPFLHITDQLALLQQRGMIIDHPDDAADSLRHIGYYRLSAYWYPFRAVTVEEISRGKLQRPSMRPSLVRRAGHTERHVMAPPFGVSDFTIR